MSIDNVDKALLIDWYINEDGEKITQPITDESHVVINGKISLLEIPHEFDGVAVKDGSTVLYEIDHRDSETEITSDKFKVHYGLGMIFFHSSMEGKTLSVSYSSRGMIMYPANRIYTDVNENDGSVTNLQNVVDDVNQALVDLQNLGDTVTEGQRLEGSLTTKISDGTTLESGLITATNNADAKKTETETATATAEAVRINLESKTTEASNSHASLTTKITEANAKIIELNNHTDVKKAELDSHTITKEDQLDVYEGLKEGELEAYTTIKKVDLDNYVGGDSNPAVGTKKKDINDFVEVKKTELDTHTTSKESQLDTHTTAKEGQLDTHKNVKISEITAHTDNKKTELEDYVGEDVSPAEGTKKKDLDDYTTAKRAELDTHTTSKKGELDTHTTSKLSEITTHTNTKIGEVTTHTNTKKTELDTHTTTKEGQLDTYTASREGDLDSHTIIKKGELDTYVGSDVNPASGTKKKDIDEYTVIKKGELDSHTTAKEDQLDTHTETKKSELDSHETVKEGELNSHTTSKKSELDVYRTAKETELNTYTSTKKSELDTHNDAKKSELDDYIGSDINPAEGTKKKEINNFIIAKKGELDTYTSSKESQLDAYTISKEGQLDTYTTAKESQIDTYTGAKESQLDTYRAAKEVQLDAYTSIKEGELDTHTATKKSEVTTHTNEKKVEIDTYVGEDVNPAVGTKKKELDDYVASKRSELDGKISEANTKKSELETIISDADDRHTTLQGDLVDVDGKIAELDKTNQRIQLYEDYNPTTTYYHLNKVRYAGDTYICLKEEGITGVTPVDDRENWILMVKGSSLSVEESSINGNILVDEAELVIYQHPASHNASMVVEDANHRFITDVEKIRWNDTYTQSEVDNLISQVLSNIDWKESVATFGDIATTYSLPEDGWVVNVQDTDETYRYDGTQWIKISANSIPLATQSVDGKMSSADKIRLDNMENNANHYIHPSTHNPSEIATDVNNRFVSDTQISNWDSKQDAIGYTPENVANRGQANGYASLGSDGKVPAAQIPSLGYLPLTGGNLTGHLYMTNNKWIFSQYDGVSDQLRMNANPGGFWDFFNQTQNDWSDIKVKNVNRSDGEVYYHSGNFDPSSKADVHSHPYDNYGSWSFAVDGATKDAITSGDVLDFVSGANVTITRSADDKITIAASDNTWRGVVDNLTSGGTEVSLSAEQGKALKGLVDGKADSHSHPYLPLTGGNISGHLEMQDNVELRLGNDADVKMYFNGTNGVINNGTGDFYLQVDGKNSVIASNSAEIQLLYNGVKKVETTSTGAKVTGHLEIDGGVGALKLKPSTADHVYIEMYSNTDSPTSRSGWIGYGSVNTTTLTMNNEIGGVIISPSVGATELQYSGVSKLQTTSTGAKVTGDFDLTSGDSDYTLVRIANTSTGFAGISFDASNGDFTGSDYANISQLNNLDFAISTNLSAGDITISPKGWQQTNVTARFTNTKTTLEKGVLELGKYDSGDTRARGMLLETTASASGEASGRLFFSEHNSGDGLGQDNYGMSLFYNGDTTATYPSGAVYSDGNAVWGIKRHDNNQNGALVISGSRLNSDVTFHGNIYGTYGNMFRSIDEWLRINDLGEHASGIYCGSSILRTDGELQVGGSGANFRVEADGAVVMKNKFLMEYNSTEDSLDFTYLG